MNKYRKVQMDLVGAGAQKPIPVVGRLDGGIVRNKSPQDIELNQSPSSDIVRVELGALRQDYKVEDAGSAAATKILALGEHKFVISGDSIYETLFRMYLTSLAAATVEIDVWDGASFAAAINTGGTDSLTLARVLASWKSYFDQVFFATGGDIIRWIRSAAFTAQDDDFTSANALTAANDSVTATVVPAGAYNSSYDIHYSVTITGPSSAGAQVVLSFIDGGANVVAAATYNLPTSTDTSRSLVYAHEIKNIIGAVTSGQTITLKLLLITQSEVLRTVTLSDTGSEDFQGSKVEAREATSDLYLFKYSIFSIGTCDIALYYDSGAGWVLIDTIVGVSAGDFEYPATINGMGAADKFRVVASNKSASPKPTLYAASVEWLEPFEVSVHGFNAATDSDPSEGVTYETEGSVADAIIDIPKSITSDDTGTATAGGASTITDSGATWTIDALIGDWIHLTDGTGVGQLRKITDNTATVITVRPAWTTTPDATSVYQIGTPTYAEARYLGIFANRLLLLQDGGDVQKIGWSINGVPEVLFGDGAGEAVRRGYSDPIDKLMGFQPLNAQVGALFRQRSIERAVATGQVDPAIGFYRWIEEIGTESPFSITSVPGGIMFFGHDRLVYYLTESSLIPIGQAIQEEFYSEIGDLSVVEGEYDPIAQDYMMSVPSTAGTDTAVTWFFDMDRFLREGTQVWQRHTRTMNRLAIVESEVYFADEAYAVHYFNREDVEDAGYWESPMLNREDPSAEYTLHRVELRYQTNGATPTIYIEGTPDGGVTWKSGYKSSVALVDTQNAILKVVVGFDNVTGHDVRFRIRFDGTARVLVHGYRADLNGRGDIGDDN